MDWEMCCNQHLVKEVTPDKGLIESLKQSSQNVIKTNETIILNETTASTKVSLMYDSVRELLEALALSNGFKIYNHECFTSFLVTKCVKLQSANKFDRFRKIRNGLRYYGQRINTKEAHSLISEMKGLYTELIKML